MTARPLLMVLNARDMAECMASFRALDVPRAFLTGYTERELCTVIPRLIRDTDFTHYVAVSDDVVVTRAAVDAVYQYLDGRPVVTGWCNLDGSSPLCSVVDRPLEVASPWGFPDVDTYGFMHWTKVAFSPQRLIRTWFAGMCLTGMSREMWQRYPFDVLPTEDGSGCCSDFRLCWRLQHDNVPIAAVRDAGVLHVRQQWDVPDRDPRKRLIVGRVPARVEMVL